MRQPLPEAGAFASPLVLQADIRFPTKALYPRPGLQAAASRVPRLSSLCWGLRRGVARDPSRAPRQVLAARLGEEGGPDAAEWPCRAQSCTDRSMVPPQSPLTGWEGETSRQAGTWWPSSDDWAPQAELGTDRVSVPQGGSPSPPKAKQRPPAARTQGPPCLPQGGSVGTGSSPRGPFTHPGEARRRPVS